MKNVCFLLLVTLSLSGCGTTKLHLMQKESDSFPVSDCEKCNNPPFYVNGHYVDV